MDARREKRQIESKRRTIRRNENKKMYKEAEERRTRKLERNKETGTNREAS